MVLYSHKKSGLFAGLMLLALLVVSIPAARADPGFTLEDFTTWYGIGDTQIRSVAVGNVDGDLALEIVTGGWYHDGTRKVADLTVWDGSTLALRGVRTWYWTSDTYIESVAVADLDGDGFKEIVTGGHYWDGTHFHAQLCVWSCIGGTLFIEDVKTWYWTGDTVIFSVACADVDDDGSKEIVTGGHYNDGTRFRAQLCVWNGATLALEDVKTWYWTGTTEIFSVALGNLDGDPSMEIVTGGFYWDGTRSNAQLAVWDGSTLALEGVRTWYWTSETRIESVAVGDVDGDGGREVVTGGYYHDGTRYRAQLCVWTGSTLALEGVKTWHWTSSTEIYSVVVEGVDGDPSPEIVTGGHYWYGTRYRAQLCVWDGSTLSLEGVKTWYWVDTTEIQSVAAANVDGDWSPATVEIITGGHFNDGTRDVAQLCVWGFT